METGRNIGLSFEIVYKDVNEERVRALIESHNWNFHVTGGEETLISGRVKITVDKGGLISEGYSNSEIEAAVAVLTGAVIFGKK